MSLDEQLDRSLAKLRDAIAPHPSIVADVMARTSCRHLPGGESRIPARAWSAPFRRPRFAAAAAIATIALVGASIFVFGQRSSAAFANQALAALQQAKADRVTVKERIVVVMRDGTRHFSSTSHTYFVGRDGYRRDIYDNDKLRESQWYTRKGDGMLQTSVRFDTKTYTLQSHTGRYGKSDPVERMSLLIKFIDDADRRLEPITLNGRKCPGFEIRSSKYGSNPNDWLDRIWFDPVAKLPVRIEQERPRSEKEIKSFITVQEQFDWSPDLSADTFTPKIPDGFAVQI